MVAITVRNTTKLPRQAQLIRVDGDRSAADLKRVIESEDASLPVRLHAPGGAVLKPEATAKVTIELVPASYFPTGTDGPDFEGTPAKIARFTVSAGNFAGQAAPRGGSGPRWCPP